MEMPTNCEAKIEQPSEQRIDTHSGDATPDDNVLENLLRH